MRVSDDRRHLVGDDGEPFFWLADTAWRFFYLTDHAMAERYLAKRAAQGFTAFMPVLLSEVFAGEDDASRFGQLALHDWDPTRPNEEFFAYVDWTVAKAQEHGLVAAILPTWGEFVGPLRSYGKGPVIFNVANARVYGRFLGERYREAPNVAWVLGGDRVPREGGVDYTDVWRAMASGLREGDGGRHLISFHPAPVEELDQFSSGYWLPDEEWIDFNMLQTGTRIDRPNYAYVRRDYERSGRQMKPVLDGECRYEHSHEFFWNRSGRRIDAHQVRKAAYNSLLSGACGHTYGCRCVWNFYHEGAAKTRDTDLDWRRALDLPGAWQMRHLRRLFTDYPFWRLAPDFAGRVVVFGNGDGGTFIPAAVSRARDFFLAYLPEAMPFKVDLSVLAGPARLRWFDVRTGEYLPPFASGATGEWDVFPLEHDDPGLNDYVLVGDLGGDGAGAR